MIRKLLVVLEQRDSRIKKTSFEVCSIAAKFAAKNKVEVVAIAIGDEITNLSAVSDYGISSIIHVKHAGLALYSSSAYKKIILNYINKNAIDYILLTNTAFGRDIAPRIAARLRFGLLSDCISLEITPTGFKAARPIYSGKAIQEIETIGNKGIATIRANVFPAAIQSVSANIMVQKPELIDLSNRTVEIIKSDGKIDVSEADIIISGGRGMKGPENFHLIEDVAAILGGALGASRAAVDAGWRSHSEQIGQTGKTVSPSLYIACGISGSVQHLAGMSTSKYIVAINKDKDAPIFSVADYGITGDLFEILPVLTDEIKKLNNRF